MIILSDCPLTAQASEIRSSVAVLHRCITEPAAACGVLLWAHVVLTNPRFSASRYNLSFMPDVLRLLLTIAATHPALIGAVGTLLHACLVHEPPSDSESNALTIVALRRRLLDGLLLLLARGYTLPVLAVFRSWLRDADLSLVRHLLQQLLALAAPPFSAAFADHILAMLRHPRTLEAHRAAESRRPLLAFAQQAQSIAGVEAAAAQAIHVLSA